MKATTTMDDGREAAPIGLHVREAVKGWTYALIVTCDDDDGNGEYPDSPWTGGSFSSYFDAWAAAQDEAKRLGTVVLGVKKTQKELDEEAARQKVYVQNHRCEITQTQLDDQKAAWHVREVHAVDHVPPHDEDALRRGRKRGYD